MSLRTLKRGAAAWLVLVAVLLLGVAETRAAHDTVPETPPTPQEQTSQGQPPAASYTVTINVPSGNGLRSDILASSELVRLQEQPPATHAALQRRINDDTARFKEVMRSAGYYDSDIHAELAGNAPPYAVTVTITPGERFTFGAFDIVFAGGLPSRLQAGPTLEDAAIKLGSPALADEVPAAEARLVRWLADRGYPFARVADRLVLLDRPDRMLWVQVTLRPGPYVTFGPLDIAGLKHTNRSFIEKYVGWHEGDTYDQRLVDALRNRLAGSGVFSSVSVSPQGDARGPSGERTIDVALTEGPARTISAGVAYDTYSGPEVRLGWQHRNLFGNGEQLSIQSSVGLLRRRVDTTLRVPDYMRLNQDLVLRGNLLDEKLEAYHQTGVETSAALERKLSKTWKGSAGVAADYFKLSQDIGSQRSLIVGLPVTLAFDNSNSLLNPTRGFRLSLSATPWNGLITDNVRFLQTRADATAYQPLDDNARLVAAVRAEVGTIIGAGLDAIPANRRFYAGGGGTIRGYEYQKVGPLDVNNNPTGGKSIMVVGAELRTMVTKDFGVVPFIEGGNVFADTRPNFAVRPFFRWGAGLGLRYLTAVGPVRFDVAVPLDRRHNIDDAYQFYISLGQAF